MVEFTTNISSVSEMRACYNYGGASLGGSSSWIDLIHHRRMVVVEDFHIIRILLVIQSNFHIHPSQNIARRRVAHTLSCVDDLSFNKTQLTEATERVIAIIHLVEFIYEGVEVVSFKQDTGTSFIRASVWNELGN